MALMYITAHGQVTFTTGKIATLNNHLLRCSYVPDTVKGLAREWQRNDDTEGEAGKGEGEGKGEDLPSSSTSNLKKRSRVDPHPCGTKKQQKFTVVAARAHS